MVLQGAVKRKTTAALGGLFPEPSAVTIEHNLEYGLLRHDQA
jgi:hypothetical protein